MIASRIWLAPVLLCAPVFSAEPVERGAPAYSAASIVNAASFQAEAFGPNTIVSIFGKELAFGTAALRTEDIRGGILPTTLPGSWVNVLVNGLSANIFYASPTQINFLIPSNLRAGPLRVSIVRQGLAGPEVEMRLKSHAPAIFQSDPATLLATRADGSPILPDSPARPGEIIVLYATGLGDTLPPQLYSKIAPDASQIAQRAELRVHIDGEELDRTNILYAGVSPGFAGLYQINVRLPDHLNENPEVVVSIGDNASPTGLRLPVHPETEQ